MLRPCKPQRRLVKHTEASFGSVCCQRELKMAAERRQTGAEPSSADGGQALGWMAGFEGSSLLGWKWISEWHNGSLRRVCGALLKPCLLCPGSFMPSGACGRQLLHAAFLIAAASPALAATAAARHPSKAGINLQHGAVVQCCHMQPLVELIRRAVKPSPSVFGGVMEELETASGASSGLGWKSCRAGVLLQKLIWSNAASLDGASQQRKINPMPL